MKRVMPFALALLAVAPLAGQTRPAEEKPAEAQSPAAPPSKANNETIQVNVNLVNVLFTVTDKKNRMVLNLTRDDFEVFEDQKAQRISRFSRETDLPLRIGLLIDTSNSVRDRLRFEQEAAVDFLTTTLRPGRDKAFVVGFDVEPQLVQDYTDDMERLSTAIRRLQAGGTTALYDCIFFAAKQKMLIFPPPEPYLRRVMIIISDGLDNQSEHVRDEALGMAQRGEVTIYCISTNRTGPESRGDRVLKFLAEQTGGRAFFPFAREESDSAYEGFLSTNFQSISRELRSQYSLAYVPANLAHDGSFRAISVATKTKDLRVRAKAGYFAPSP